MTYCDTNVLTAFVNKEELRERFGDKEARKYPHIRGFRGGKSGEFLKSLDKCKVSKMALLNDIKRHQASMGGVLTSLNLRRIELEDVDGYNTGKRVANIVCRKKDEDMKKFRNSFCREGRLKKNLKENQIEDIRHFGSAIELGEKRVLTDDKELNSLNKYLRRKRKI